MSGNAREIMEETFKALERRDMAAVLDAFADDAVLFDPHYPVRRMEGKAAIADGLKWGFSGIDRFGFTPVNVLLSEDGTKAAFEVDTHHVMKGGRKLDFPQAFFVEVRDGRITRLQAYEPYGPDGAMGIFLGLAHLKHRYLG